MRVLLPSTEAVSPNPTWSTPAATATQSCTGTGEISPEITEVLLHSLEGKFPDKCYCSLIPPRFQTQQMGRALHGGDHWG